MLMWSAALVTAIRNPQFSSRPGDEGLADGCSGALDPREHGLLSLLVSAGEVNSEVAFSLSS